MEKQTKTVQVNKIDENPQLVMDALTAGFEIKTIEGDLRCKRYETKNKVTSHITVTVRVNGQIEMVSKIAGQSAEAPIIGKFSDWSKVKGNSFDEKLQEVMKDSIEKAGLIAKLEGLSQKELEKLVANK